MDMIKIALLHLLMMMTIYPLIMMVYLRSCLNTLKCFIKTLETKLDRSAIIVWASMELPENEELIPTFTYAYSEWEKNNLMKYVSHGKNQKGLGKEQNSNLSDSITSET